MRDIVDQLLGTPRQDDLEDVEAVVGSLDLPLLTERQTEVLLRYHLTSESVEQIAGDIGVSESRVYNARQDAEEVVREAEQTLRELGSAAHSLEEHAIEQDDHSQFAHEVGDAEEALPDDA